MMGVFYFMMLGSRTGKGVGPLRHSYSEASETKGAISNSEIRKALGVSSRTAVRYLDELEKEGKVEQVGKIGHAVTCRLK